MILDLSSTNPVDWEQDKRIPLDQKNKAILYELHMRDMSIHPSSGSQQPGKYLGWVQSGTQNNHGQSTMIDHLRELGITHVHLLPTYDHYSIDESKLDSAQFNWGYDPQNYNVPEGSFASDPYDGSVRIKEFKLMVKTLHDAGIGVILDVVYNHTGRTEGSNFNKEYPGYYYRQWADGRLSDASACGNETASDKAMMRHFILNSVKYWAEEYHLDGFRFDLMGIHDQETMRMVSEMLHEVDPSILVYGEGWTAGDSPLPEPDRALKKYTHQIPRVSAFSDDIRDGLKGSVFDDASTGFVSGASGMEMSIKFGVVGSIRHPQIDYDKVNYSDTAWSAEPWQAISYVSCHDNHTLYDKLKVSRPDADENTRASMHKLANAVVLTSQGIPFLHAGVEMMRTKGGEHNSYKSPDAVNQIIWDRKKEHESIFDYHKNLIALRKKYPHFTLSGAEAVRQQVKFLEAPDGVVAYTIDGGDSGEKLLIVYNALTTPYDFDYPSPLSWIVKGDNFYLDEQIQTVEDSPVVVPPLSMAVFSW